MEMKTMTKAKKAAPVDLTGQDAIKAVEDAVSKATDQLNNIQSVASEAGELLTAAAKESYEGAVALQKEAAENLRVLTDNAVAHVNALVAVKDINEASKLQMAFVEAQGKLIQDQVKSIVEKSQANLRSAYEPVVAFSNDAVKRFAA